MMQFRTVKQAIIDTLEADAAERYEVVGSQKQSKGSNEILTPRVTVYYQSGDFPESSAGRYGSPVEHNATYRIELSVSAQGEADLSVLNTSTDPAVLSAALAAMFEASDKADEILDQAFDDVYQVLMAGKNIDYGLEQYTVQDRWVNNYQKDNPLPRGEYVVLTGNCQLTVSLSEELLSETGTAGVAYDTTVDIKDDQGDNAGASGNLGG